MNNDNFKKDFRFFLETNDVTSFIDKKSIEQYQFLAPNTFYLLLSFLEVLDKRSHGYFKNSDVLNTSFTYFITSFYWYFTSFMNEYLKQINYSYYRDTRMREFLLKDITVDKIVKFISEKLQKDYQIKNKNQYKELKYSAVIEEFIIDLINYLEPVIDKETVRYLKKHKRVRK